MWCHALMLPMCSEDHWDCSLLQLGRTWGQSLNAKEKILSFGGHKGVYAILADTVGLEKHIFLKSTFSSFNLSLQPCWSPCLWLPIITSSWPQVMSDRPGTYVSHTFCLVSWHGSRARDGRSLPGCQLKSAWHLVAAGSTWWLGKLQNIGHLFFPF